MNTNNLFFKWIQELFMRFFSKSPAFFKVWQWLAGLTAALTGLPEFLQMFNITLPASLSVLENKTVAIAATVAFFMSAMTTQSTVTSLDASGNPIKQTDTSKLPFTTVSEKKQLTK